MGNYRYYIRDKVLTDTGLKYCGVCTYDVSGYDGPYGWFSNPNSPPYGFTSYAPTGIDCKAAFTEAQATPGLEVTLFKLTNGARFYVTSTGSTTWTLWGERGGSIYSLYTGQDFPGASAQYIYVDLAYHITPSDVVYNTIFITYKGPYGGQTMYSARFKSTSNWTTEQAKWNVLLSGEPTDLNDPYITVPDNENPGPGYGPYDYTSEEDLPPALPSIGAAQSQFVSLWTPTLSEIRSLAEYLWTDNWWVSTWTRVFAEPMDCILSLGIVPFEPSHGENKEEIKFGGTGYGESGVNAYRVTDQMYVLDMGSMHITGMSQGYTDYEPYAKASLFLPYCGTYAISCDEIMDADVALEYHIDIYTGACVAYLTITRTNSNGESVHAVMYQFTGNVLCTIPVTASDHSQFIQSLLFMGAAIGATVATAGGAAPEIGGAMAAGDAITISPGLTAAVAGSAINTVMSMKPNIMRSGNLSSNAGLLGKQKPTITITWSNICKPTDEYKLAGLPVHKSGTLSSFEGFTVVSAVHMDNILCTDAELHMIEQALFKGVIV